MVIYKSSANRGHRLGTRFRPRWRQNSATFPDAWLSMKGPTAWFKRLPIPHMDRPCTIRVADIHHTTSFKPVAVVPGAYSSFVQLCRVCGNHYCSRYMPLPLELQKSETCLFCFCREAACIAQCRAQRPGLATSQSHATTCSRLDPRRPFRKMLAI